jgi:hypothetical protein
MHSTAQVEEEGTQGMEKEKEKDLTMTKRKGKRT